MLPAKSYFRQSGPGGAGGKPSARGAVGLGFDSRRLPSLGLSAPPASTRSEDGLPRSRSLEEEKEPSCKWEPINPLEGIKKAVGDACPNVTPVLVRQTSHERAYLGFF